MHKLRWLARAWRYRLKHDPGEINHILANLSVGDLAIDIGAHKGAYTYWLRKGVGKSGRVVAFEPQPVLAKKLLQLTAGWSNVSVENLGVSSEPTKKELFIPGAETSQEATFEQNAKKEFGHSYFIQTVKLDEYFADRQTPIKFIKCDVEGHELDVFKGATDILTVDRPAIFFECENRHQTGGRTIYDVFEYLTGKNYVGRFFSNNELLPLTELKQEMTVHKTKADGYVNNFWFTPHA